MGKNLRDLYLDKVFKSNNYGNFQVIEYISCKKITVKFLNTGFIKNCQIKEVRDGNIRDDTIQDTIFGWGVNDSVDNVYIRDARGKQICCKIYSTWVHLLRRCLCNNFKTKQPAYKDASVCEEWKYFSNFRRWVLEEQPNKDWQNCHLDKDLLVEGNKCYSPSTCCFIPQELNQFLKVRGNDRGLYMVGVSKSSTRFISHIQINSKRLYLGSFLTEIEAHKAWQTKKHEYACQQAGSQQDPRVVKALRERYAPDKDLKNI